FLFVRDTETLGQASLALVLLRIQPIEVQNIAVPQAVSRVGREGILVGLVGVVLCLPLEECVLRRVEKILSDTAAEPLVDFRGEHETERTELPGIIDLRARHSSTIRIVRPRAFPGAEPGRQRLGENQIHDTPLAAHVETFDRAAYHLDPVDLPILYAADRRADVDRLAGQAPAVDQDLVAGAAEPALTVTAVEQALDSRDALEH